MTVLSSLATPTGAARAGTITATILPTPTELDRWPGTSFESGRIAFENLDTTQTYDGWLEVRPVSGAGTFSVLATLDWNGIAPLTCVDRRMPDDAIGAGEVRFMATTNGAGGSANYTRRQLHLVNT